MLRGWQKELDESGNTGTVLIGLSKSNVRLPSEFIIAKFESYGFDNISLNFFYSYFSNRKQKVKIGSAISEWIDMLTGISQGSILGPLIFNIFINDLIMLIEKSDICNFANDNTYTNLVPACR